MKKDYKTNPNVLSAAADQRFFALGLLKLEDTAALYEQLVILKNRVESRLLEDKRRKGKSPPRKPFEFKFSSMTKTSHTFYFDLIDLYFKFKHLSFCCLLFDKERENINVTNYFDNPWDAYISYSKLLVKHNIKNGDGICVIADFLGKPKSSTKYYETELRYLPNVYNACMIESHASLFIQLVDVLIGCVAYDYKIFREKRPKTDRFKKKVCNFLKDKINKDTLEGDFTIYKPNYFNVWEFNPNKKCEPSTQSTPAL